MIKLSVRAMAQYLVSDDAARIRLLRERKYRGPESTARARFYSEARTSIAAYHRGALSRDALEAKIIAMRREARYCKPSASTELWSNADVLERYLYYQGHRTLELAPPPTADLVRGDVEIAVRPSLFGNELGNELGNEDDDRRLIFLELRERPIAPAMRIIAELAFEAFRPVLRNLSPRAVQVIDVRRGVVTELPQPGSAIGRELAEACKAISALWPQLPPPAAGPRARRPQDRQLAIAWDAES